MALINCPECGKNVSTKAKACPNCGAPITLEDVASLKHVGKNWEPCPRCGSNKVNSRGVFFWFLMGFCLTGLSIWLLIIPPVGVIGILLGLFFMLIAPFAYKMRQCKDCNYSWRYPSKKHKKQKSQISTMRGCLIILLVVFGIIAAYVTSDQKSVSRPASSAPPTQSKPKSSTPVAQYTVVSKEDVSYANVVRKSYRVRVPREMTTEELTAISDEIVRQVTSRQKINAIMIFFFLPDSDTRGAFTAGKATWAPGGDWSKASTSLSPKLVVETGGAMGTISKENVVDLPVAKKKQIFIQIVRFQDAGMDSNQSYEAAAKQFGVTLDQANKISLEGVVKGWPMP